jgi:hypothetical protein
VAIRAVTLKIRVKTTAGKWCVVKPVTDVKGRLKPLYAMVAGKPEHHARVAINCFSHLRKGPDGLA